MDLEGTKLDTFRRSCQRRLDLTAAAMHRAGVPLVATTNALSGLGL